MRTKLALLAFLLLTVAVLRSGGSFDAPSLFLVLAALAAALAGCATLSRPEQDRFAETALPRLLGGLLGVELLWLALRPESAHLSRERLALPPVLAATLIGLLALSYAWRAFPWPRVRFPLILAVYFALGGWLLLEVAPAPAIDVWHFQQHAAELLLEGKDPYAGEFPNPYGDARFLPESMLRDGKIQAFPYPPLSLLLVVPGYLLGDVRWCLLLAMVGAAGFMVATGRRLGLPAGHPVELAAVAALCNPWGVLVIEFAWTEPLLALAITFTTWALAGGRQRSATLGLLGVLSLKQYGFLLLPAFAASRRVGVKEVLCAAAGSCLLAMPFFLWDPAAFWRGLVEFHFRNPFRPDSLSVSAALAVTTGCHLPGWVGLLAAAVVGTWLWRRGTPGLAKTALGGAALVLAFFAFNRAAHLNYYWLALLLLALGVIVSRAEQNGSTGPGPPPDSDARLH